MTISSSLNAGVAGLSVNASRLATIADNIANSGTHGYKKAVADFSSMVVGQSSGIYSAGGVRVTTQRLIDETGALGTTNNPTDLAVRGRGFLPVSTISAVHAGDGADLPLYLATTGSFRTDADGYLVTPSGIVLMGWPAETDGSIPTFPRDTSAGLEPVQVNVNQFTSEPTTRISLGINLPGTDTTAGSAGDTRRLSIEYFDNLGTSQSIEASFTPTVPATGDPASNTWTMELRDSASNNAIIGEYTVIFDDSRTGGGTIQNVTQAGGAIGGAWNASTGAFTVDVLGGPVEINIGAAGTGAGITQLSDNFAPTSISKDGSQVGTLTSVEVDENGFVHANFDVGITRTVYQIPLADLSNPNGLQAQDKVYSTSSESGDFFLWDAGHGPTGDVVSYALEESTTDVAAELTLLIQTQRAYSSNAKIIQTVDEMLQETTNIIR